MKAAIMQPYFFPYIGYISLIKHTDRFILFDTVQFIRHGWIERNRVLKQNGDWLYIQVPLIKTGRETLIKDVKINNAEQWQSRLISQLQPYKKIAPFYRNVLNVLAETFAETPNSITELDKRALEAVCLYLGIDKRIEIFSEMNLTIEKANAPDEWALNICKALGNIDTYWNPPGGMEFFDKQKYLQAGIDLRFQKMNLQPYNQKREVFEVGLSIIDVMMFNSVEEIHSMLDNFELT